MTMKQQKKEKVRVKNELEFIENVALDCVANSATRSTPKAVGITDKSVA